MALRHPLLSKTAAVVLPVLLLSACGGGGGGSTGGGAATPTGTGSTPVRTSEVDAVRLAQQATFGPTTSLVDHLSATDIDTWLNEQFAATGSTYADLAGPLATTHDYCKNNDPTNACSAKFYWGQPVAMRFYANAVSQPDQLRQRVAFSLSQLLVASSSSVPSTAGLASLNQIFLDNAFGNYRDILKAVTLNPFMGDYLNLADSSSRAPNENYAREFLQLFSMGLNALNPDGTPKLDAAGAAIPNYTPADIKAVARALTGWSYAQLNGGAVTDFNTRDYSKPMIMVSSRYDTNEKVFLGTTVASGTSQDASLQAVVDAAFNNASTAPYVSKFLIQSLVTANPSAAYVGRVAAKFADNGAGVRGDMKAVIRAILTDAEARGARRTGPSDGKVKEPILLMVALARAVGMTTDGYAFTQRDGVLGQEAFHAPSVFNYYPPNFPLPQSATLVSPASKLMTSGYIVQRHNFVWDWTINGESRWEFAPATSVAGATGSTLNWAGWQSLGGDADALVTRINMLLFADGMTAAQQSALKSAVAAIKGSDSAAVARKRAELAFYVAATSPQFQVDR